MLLPAILLDAEMTVADTRSRLARYGLWVDPTDPDVAAVLREHVQRLGGPVVPVLVGDPDGAMYDESAAATVLARDPRHFGVAIRRQWRGNVLWYARSAAEVLARLRGLTGGTSLRDALSLHETDSEPVADIAASVPSVQTVMTDGASVVAVNVEEAQFLDPAGPRVPLPEVRRPRGTTRGTQPAPTPDVTTVDAWPRLDAPSYVMAAERFDVSVGFAAVQQALVTGGQVRLPVRDGRTKIDVSVELIADGFDAPEGWSKLMPVDVSNATAASVTFVLVARLPRGEDPFHLSMLEVRYVVDGTICGTASRPIVVGAADRTALASPGEAGTPWLKLPSVTTPVSTSEVGFGADLTIEFAKPDQNPATGRYVCRLYSQHPLAANRGPHEVYLGEDARTFARSLVMEVKQVADSPLLDLTMEGIGSLVAKKLPDAARQALAEVTSVVAPSPPTVLIISADQYVPWELALLDPPLFADRPPYLGAQVIVGRWTYERPLSAAVPPTSGAVRIERPPATPVSTIPVKHMAVMAGWYSAASGLRQLPAAEQEALALVASHGAIPLAADGFALAQLLRAELSHGLARIGAPGAVHFAGHGDFDKAEADGARLFLSDGTPVSSITFRRARYGGSNQPFIFLNACMAGIGGELLGDAGGFPGNCLNGGFGAVLGALWEVDDNVANEIAEEFWRRVLPKVGTPEPVAVVLRDLRAKYAPGFGDPVPTYLAYVFYGHPRLVLQPVS